MKKNSKILAIDPGRSKWGGAVVDSTREILERGIYSMESLYPTVERMVKEHSITLIVLGDGTNSKSFSEKLLKLEIEIHWINESGSTEEAKILFDSFYPPSGLRRLIPRGLRYPNRDFDDLAAVVLANRYWDDSGNGFLES